MLVGQEIERVIPHSRMREVVETGHPHPLDIIQYGDRWLLVTRLPLRDETGAIIGAIAFALKDSIPYLRPIAERLHQMQSRLSPDGAGASPRQAGRRASTCRAHPRREPRHATAGAPAAPGWRGRVSPVLLLGETGTGKEMAAHAIHAASKPHRAARSWPSTSPPCRKTCWRRSSSAWRPGAFTGAARQPRPGKFQIAHEGTLFLDEIGDMPLALQTKLLRTLQEGEVEPVGSNQLARVDVRVIAATSRPLAEMVRAGTFRQDLYYRLNVISIPLPPLRERPGDIELLATRFSEQKAAAFSVPVRPVTRAALARLSAHAWPGNVRELANVIERIYACTEGARIEARDVDAAMQDPSWPAPDSAPPQVQDLATAVAELERAMIADALAQADGNRREAARRLGLSRSTLYVKMQRYGLGAVEAGGDEA